MLPPLPKLHSCPATLHNEKHKMDNHATYIYFIVLIKIWQQRTSPDNTQFQLNLILHDGTWFFRIKIAVTEYFIVSPTGSQVLKLVLLPAGAHRSQHLFITPEIPLMVYFSSYKIPSSKDSWICNSLFAGDRPFSIHKNL